MKVPIYLDHHATTAVDAKVLEKMLPYFSEHYGNASSSSYSLGLRAQSAIQFAREQVAQAIGADSAEEIIFTSGATESNNLALFGFLPTDQKKSAHVITTPIEHPSVLETAMELKRRGVEVSFVGVDSNGQVLMDELEKAIRPETVLVSVILAHNEIGTIQELKKISPLCKARGILLHTDASQALGKIPVLVNELGVDLLSSTAHKYYGPKGTGFLYCRKDHQKKLLPILFGGSQEHGFRSGTSNTPGIVGCGEALRLSMELLPLESVRLKKLRDQLFDGIRSKHPDVKFNGHPEIRLPGNLSLTCPANLFRFFTREFKEIAISTGAACHTGEAEPSKTLKAIGLSDEEARRTIRFGLGRTTTEEEIRFVIDRV